MTKEQVRLVIQQKVKDQKACIIGIDGMSASGKSTFSEELKTLFSAQVIHMDDYFLKENQRTEERLSEIGGNIDYERFLEEVIKPLKAHQTMWIYPYNCQTKTMDKPYQINPSQMIIIEGAYSLHPKWSDIYDLKIMFEITSETQKKRIIDRNGMKRAQTFISTWIPKENKYLTFFNIKEHSDLVITVE